MRNIVKQSVNRVLNEGGHLYSKHEDGTVFTNSKDRFHGIPGTVFIYHGSWSDPTVLYDGEEYNGAELEDSLWDMYQTECREEGREPSTEEYDNLPTSWFENNFEDIMFGMSEY